MLSQTKHERRAGTGLEYYLAAVTGAEKMPAAVAAGGRPAFDLTSDAVLGLGFPDVPLDGVHDSLVFLSIAASPVVGKKTRFWLPGC